jgi:hypothetical protein
MKLKNQSEFNSSFYLKNSHYSFKFYFMFSCIYPDMCIVYSITSSDRSIGHYLQTH